MDCMQTCIARIDLLIHWESPPPNFSDSQVIRRGKNLLSTETKSLDEVDVEQEGKCLLDHSSQNGWLIRIPVALMYIAEEGKGRRPCLFLPVTADN